MAVESEHLWILVKPRGCYVAEMLTFGDAVWLNLRRDGERILRVEYASRDDALRDALNYRAGLEMAGWSAAGLKADSLSLSASPID